MFEFEFGFKFRSVTEDLSISTSIKPLSCVTTVGHLTTTTVMGGRHTEPRWYCYQ